MVRYKTICSVILILNAAVILAGTSIAVADDRAPVKAATATITEFPPIVITPGPFSADAESFKKYQYPDWFRDAKLGIWAHWGPQSVPMEGDWYARRMYLQGDGDYKDHLARYGPDSKTGYKDIIPLWKAEKWDPDGLMALYKKAGARYLVAQAVHHDNFDNWNSRYHRWNSVNMGPHRDVVGDWQKAAVRQGLRFGVSEHLGASYTWFQPSHGSDKTGPLAGVPYDGANPEFADLYHSLAAPGDTGWYSNNPVWQLEWFDRIKDVVDQYHPDLLYSDGAVPFGNDVGRSMIAHLYNESAKRNHGTADAVYNCKQDSHGMWVQDLERGMMAGIQPYPWQTDTSIGDWFYNRHWKYRSCQWVVHSLIDIVSKNGNLLINVVQRPDGTLDDDALKIVNDLATWTAVNGEGIYGTRPWLVYGEGKHQTKGGSFNEDHAYSSDDLRFTSKGDATLYAFALGWPADHQLLIRSLGAAPGVTGKVSKVSLLGSTGEVKWEMTPDGLHVTLPEIKPSEFAICLKIEGKNLRGFRPDLTVPAGNLPVKADAAGHYVLSADAADLTGKLHTETRAGQTSIGFWDDPADKAGWKVDFKSAGKYHVTAEYASIADCEVELDVGGQKVRTVLSSTGSWDQYMATDVGDVEIKQPGVQAVAAHSRSTATWKPVNLRNLKLSPK
jgi:alpha-L-fucosidase